MAIDTIPCTIVAFFYYFISFIFAPCAGCEFLYNLAWDAKKKKREQKE